MIDAKELRTGDYLKYYIGEEGSEWDFTKIDWQDIEWCSERNENFNQVHKPISLTPELLLKCGLFKDNYEIFIKYKNDARKSDSKIQFWIKELNIENRWVWQVCIGQELNKLIELRNLKYLHELQNLVYFLVGEELIINF